MLVMSLKLYLNIFTYLFKLILPWPMSFIFGMKIKKVYLFIFIIYFILSSYFSEIGAVQSDTCGFWTPKQIWKLVQAI